MSHWQDTCTEEPASAPAYCIWESSAALLYSRFSKPAPMFLDDSFRKWARIREFVPPFGIKGQGMLRTLTHSTLTSHLPDLSPYISGRAVSSEVPMLAVHPLPCSQQCLTCSSSFPSCLFSYFFNGIFTQPSTLSRLGIQHWSRQIGSLSSESFRLVEIRHSECRTVGI